MITNTSTTHALDRITRMPIIRSCVRLFLAAWLSTYQGVLSDDLIMLQLAISRRYELTGLPAWLWW